MDPGMEVLNRINRILGMTNITLSNRMCIAKIVIKVEFLQMGAQALLGVRLLGYSNWLNRQKRIEKVVDQEFC